MSETEIFTELPVQKQAITLSPVHILVLGGLGALGPLSTDMYLPALPSVSQDLATSVSAAQLTLSASIFGLALGQVVAGPLSDMLGRRRPLLIGMVAFALASLLCVIAPSVEMLTIFRFGQGIAGAAGIAIALAVASDIYTGATLARCFALLMMVNALAPILSPVIGSQLLNFTSWRGIFVILTIIGAILFVAIWFSLPESLPTSRRQAGGVRSTLQIFLDLIKEPTFIKYALVSGFVFAAAIVYISVSPFILQNLYGFTSQACGWLFGFNALGLTGMSYLSSRLAGRVSPRKLLSIGVGVMVFSNLTLLLAVILNVGLIGILPTLFLMTASFGLVAPNATTLVLSNTRAAGSASALLGKCAR